MRIITIVAAMSVAACTPIANAYPAFAMGATYEKLLPKKDEP